MAFFDGPVAWWAFGLLTLLVIIPMQWSLYRHGKEIKRLKKRLHNSERRAPASSGTRARQVPPEPTLGGKVGGWLIDTANAWAAWRGKPTIGKRERAKALREK